jgi:hypothetical protein
VSIVGNRYLMQQVYQNTLSTVIVYLVDSSNEPATGLAFGDVSVDLKTNSSLVFVSKPLAIDTWIEVGFGVYMLYLSAEELEEVGSLVVKASAVGVQQFVEIMQVLPSSALPDISVDTCAITGYVYGVDGNPVEGASVTARVLGFPATFDDVATLADITVTVTTDENGGFSISLVRNALVDISIVKANYRRQLTVPDASSAVLFGIP